MQHKRLTAVALTVTVGGVGGVGTAVGTPGTGIIGAPILARGTLDADHHHHKGQAETRRSRSSCRGRLTSPSSR